MSKITITVECDDAEDARSVIDQLTGRSDAAVTTAPATPAAEKTTKPAEQTKSDVDDVVTDSDGMPWDEAVHASSRAVNTDGTWKARKGQAQAAKDARAAFKASGGDVAPPVETPTEDAAAGLPGTKAEDAVPGLPGADAIPPADPVTMADFTAKATAVLKAGKIDNDGIVAMYLEVTGQSDTNDAVKSFQTNESMRRAAVDRLTEIENG